MYHDPGTGEIAINPSIINLCPALFDLFRPLLVIHDSLRIIFEQ